MEALASKASSDICQQLHGKNHDGQSHWITLASGMAIQALLAERKGEQRVYVVTEETLFESQWTHDRWPRLRRVSDRRELTTKD